MDPRFVFSSRLASSSCSLLQLPSSLLPDTCLPFPLIQMEPGQLLSRPSHPLRPTQPPTSRKIPLLTNLSPSPPPQLQPSLDPSPRPAPSLSLLHPKLSSLPAPRRLLPAKRRPLQGRKERRLISSATHPCLLSPRSLKEMEIGRRCRRLLLLWRRRKGRRRSIRRRTLRWGWRYSDETHPGG